MKRLPTGLVHGDDLISRASFRAGLLYNDVLRLRNLEYALLLPTIAPDRVDLITLWRSRQAGVMDASSLKLLETLMPHFQLALKTRFALQGCKLENGRRGVIMDHAAGPCILLDARGSVVFCQRKRGGYPEG